MQHIILPLLLGTALAFASGAGRVSKMKSVTGPNGKTATKEKTATYGNGNATTVWTGPNGKTASKETNGTYGNGSRSATTVRTGPGGKQVTTEKTRTRTRN